MGIKLWPTSVYLLMKMVSLIPTIVAMGKGSFTYIRKLVVQDVLLQKKQYVIENILFTKMAAQYLRQLCPVWQMLFPRL